MALVITTFRPTGASIPLSAKRQTPPFPNSDAISLLSFSPFLSSLFCPLPFVAVPQFPSSPFPSVPFFHLPSPFPLTLKVGPYEWGPLGWGSAVSLSGVLSLIHI